VSVSYRSYSSRFIDDDRRGTSPQGTHKGENKEAHEGEKKIGAAPLCPILMRLDEAHRPGPPTQG
jgi:hypothetical protein